MVYKLTIQSFPKGAIARENGVKTVYDIYSCLALSFVTLASPKHGACTWSYQYSSKHADNSIVEAHVFRLSFSRDDCFHFLVYIIYVN